MKHIGIVVPTFPVLSETFVTTEIAALIETGHKVTVFCFAINTHLQSELSPEIDVVKIGSDFVFTPDCLRLINIKRIIRAYKLSAGQSGNSTRSVLYYGAMLGFEARQRGCAHLHSHFMSGSLAHAVVAGAITGIPVSCVGHGHDVYESPVDLSLKLPACKFAVAVCQHMQSTLHSLSGIRAKLVHCGVDTSHFLPHKQPVNSTTRLLFIGRLVEKKGLIYALEALAQIPVSQRPSLDIVGSGPEQEKLQQWVSQNHLSYWVNFLGFKRHHWLRSESRHYDALLAPFCEASTGDRDTGPVVLKEAMAMGLPVITTHFMGCAEIVDETCGWLVQPKDSVDLADAIYAFNKMSYAQRQKLRDAARAKVVTHFCASKQASQLSALIEECA